jgi:hypothetical protein
MISKIDKKTLVIATVAIIILLLAGFSTYRHMANVAPETGNYVGENQTEQTPIITPVITGSPVPLLPQVQIKPGDVQIEGGDGKGSFSVCLDRCGDNICQTTDPNCAPGNNLSCVCEETHQSCPQDCK